MTGKCFDFCQGFQHKTCVKVIYEVSLTLIGIVPRAVRILRLDDEVQVSFRDPPKFLLREIQGRLGQKKGSVGARVYDASRVTWFRCVRACRCRRGGLEIPIVLEDMQGDRLHDLSPLGISIDPMNLPEGLVNIGYGRDEGGPCLDGAASCFPIEWITPAVMIVTWRSGLLENFEEMNGASMVFILSENLREEGKAHGIMGVSDWESLGLPEHFTSRGRKSLAKYHRRHRQCP